MIVILFVGTVVFGSIASLVVLAVLQAVWSMWKDGSFRRRLAQLREKR
jgi:hypothetical protein